MSVTINVHHPVVQKGELGVHRNSVENQLTVSLNSSGSYNGTVILFMTDTEFNAIVNAVNNFRKAELREMTK